MKQKLKNELLALMVMGEIKKIILVIIGIMLVMALGISTLR